MPAQNLSDCILASDSRSPPSGTLVMMMLSRSVAFLVLGKPSFVKLKICEIISPELKNLYIRPKNMDFIKEVGGSPFYEIILLKKIIFLLRVAFLSMRDFNR